MAPANLMAEFRKAHQYNVFSVNTPMQYALAEYIADKDTYIGLSAFYKEKRDLFNKLFSGTKFKLRPAQGTYFQLLDYSAITDEKDTDLAIRLTKEFGVASIPISVFYHKPQDNKVLRFCFAKGNDTLEKAAEKLRKFA
jgi:methionine transaminase